MSILPFKPSVGNAQELKCPQCGKPKTAQNVGSFTSWIFQESTCDCPVVADEQGESKQSDLPAELKIDLGDAYEVISCIGTGGMGSVFKVKDEADGKEYAAKVMHSFLIRDDAAAKRFEREIQLTKQLAHPNIVTTYASGVTTDGAPYTLMDYIDGVDLEKILAQGAMDTQRALHIFIQVCNAMQYAHEQALVHRDLKPSNVLIVQGNDANEVVKIVDFGIAKLLPQEDESAAKLTQTGEVFGSPLYMSPEQCRGEPLDARSDIYSLACVMYETLAGKPPLQGVNMLEILYKHMNVMPERLRKGRTDTRISQELEAIVFKAMAKEPSSRYESMAALKGDLQRCSNNANNTGLFGRIWAVWTLRKLRARPLSRKEKMLALTACSLFVVLAGVSVSFGNLVWHGASAVNQELQWEEERVATVTKPQGNEEALSFAQQYLRGSAGPDASISVTATRVKQLTYYGGVLASFGYWSDAINAYKLALQKSEKINGSASGPTIALQEALADCYSGESDLVSAEASYRELLRRSLENDPVSWRSTWTSGYLPRAYMQLGNVLYKERKFAQAQTEYLKVLSQSTDIDRKKSPQWAMCISRLADTFRMEADTLTTQENSKLFRTDCENSQKYYEEAYKEWLLLDGEGHQNEAVALAYLAQACQRLHQNDLAQKYYPLAIRCMESALGPNHPYLAIVLRNYSDFLWSTDHKIHSIEERIKAWHILTQARTD